MVIPAGTGKKHRILGVRDIPGTFSGRTVYIETYGCRYNFGDTAKLVEILRASGASLADRPEMADAVIVNTCTVIGPTERKMLRRLSTLNGTDLYVTGCMPAVQLPAITAVCSPSVIPPEVIHEGYRSIGTVARGSTGIVQIARGCKGNCTYCITRRARGSLRSFSGAEISFQVSAFVRAGACEIQLSAQDVSAWGRDSGQSLPNLLTVLGRIPGNYRIRMGMMNPATLRGQESEIARAMYGDHFFSFLHLPVQSGSDAVLDRMGRDYTVAEFENTVRVFRDVIPGITIATDMIVGFCGETDDDFTASLDLIRRIRPAKVNVTRYSPRPFTPAYGRKDLPDSVRKDRSRILNKVAGEVYTERNRALLGTTVPFLVTEQLRKGSAMARTPEYTGVVLRENLQPGCRGKAVLVQDRKYFFIGEVAALEDSEKSGEL